MKAQLEASNLEQKKDADLVAGKLNGKSFIVVRQASDVGQLFGSVSARDIAALATEGGFTVDRNQIQLQLPIKTIGLHTVPVALHPEVEVTITINVARNAEEAERQARGENVTQRREETDEEAAAADAAAFFEKPEAVADDQGTGEDVKTD
jgi:large subunit ribosomal protein L9